ncbi:MAG: hypothetical protein U9P80_03405, partial [Thermodesulfobacteriota bacterium]|nr:hypothetical protein [Thermodesulfobacteriota bacterium]
AMDAYLVMVDAIREGGPGDLRGALDNMRGNEYLSGMLVMENAGGLTRYMHIDLVQGSHITHVKSLKTPAPRCGN